jgi:hypothetical protein
MLVGSSIECAARSNVATLAGGGASAGAGRGAAGSVTSSDASGAAGSDAAPPVPDTAPTTIAAMASNATIAGIARRMRRRLSSTARASGSIDTAAVYPRAVSRARLSLAQEHLRDSPEAGGAARRGGRSFPSKELGGTEVECRAVELGAGRPYVRALS